MLFKETFSKQEYRDIFDWIYANLAVNYENNSVLKSVLIEDLRQDIAGRTQ